MWKCKVNKADYHELLKNVLKIEDIKAYEVKQDLNCIKFLDLKSGQKIENMEFYSRPISCIEEWWHCQWFW